MLKKIPCLACRSVLCQRRSYPRVIRNQPNARRPYQVHERTAMLFFAFWRAHNMCALTLLLLVDPPTEFCASCGLFPAVGLDAFKPFFIFLFKKGFLKKKTNLEQKKENLHLQGDIVVTCFRSLKLPWHQRIFIWLREIHTDQHPYSHHKPFLYQLLWIGQEVKCTKKHKECTSQFQSHKPLLQLLSREEDMLSFIPSF